MLIQDVILRDAGVHDTAQLLSLEQRDVAAGTSMPMNVNTNERWILKARTSFDDPTHDR